MITAGVAALAKLSPALEDPDASLLPDLHDLRHISVKVAVAIANAAREEGVSQIQREDEFTEDEVRNYQWDPGACSSSRLLCRVAERADVDASLAVYRPLELVDV